MIHDHTLNQLGWNDKPDSKCDASIIKDASYILHVGEEICIIQDSWNLTRGHHLFSSCHPTKSARVLILPPVYVFGYDYLDK